MVDTVRSVTTLQTAFADNITGAISPQDLRDFLVTSLGVYGSIYEFGASTPITGIGTTPIHFTGYSANGNANGMTPLFSSNGSIRAEVDGIFDIAFQCSFYGTGSAEFKFRLIISGVAQSFGCTMKLDTGGDIVSESFFAPGVSLSALDLIGVTVASDDAGGGDSITPVYVQFTARMVG